MVEAMVCNICGSETQVRHGIDLRRDVWCCSKCLRIYRSIWVHYSGKGYSNERCIAILRGVVEKQKRRGRWAESPD
ncbi:MAG: hypothetical protein NWE79_06815 [Candidatus Bathyarchaeota archaeon]|nr:hypothetical protein [Candidatus Bathyarchaeota archaeon]